MSANMKPIDAIRDELNKRGYDVDIDINRRDICDLLGVNRKSSTKRLCGILGVEYNSHHNGDPIKHPIMFYLIDIENPLDHIEFQSRGLLSRSLLFGSNFSSSILNDIIVNQYVVWYNDRQYVISHTPQRELEPKENVKYKMVVIRQVMKGRGYDVSFNTNRKDMCSMLGLSSDSTKREIYDKLKITYVKTKEGIQIQWKKVKLTNIYDPSHVINFRSMEAAGRELKIRQFQLHTYINDQSLTVPFEGYVFNVSFVNQEDE